MAVAGRAERRIGESSRWASIAVEIRMQIRNKDIPARLPEDGPAGTGIEFRMVWNGEPLPFSAGQGTNEFYMTAFLRGDGKTELLQDDNNFASA